MQLLEVHLTTAAVHQDDPTVLTGQTYRLFVMTPESHALEPRHNNVYVDRALEKLAEAGFRPPVILRHGAVHTSAEPCGCHQRRSLILYTTYTALESCLRRGDCFHPIPLYSLPYQDSTPTKSALHDRLIWWVSNYQACDRLQMNCQVGERFGLREISRHDSALSKNGRDICRDISALSGTPTYYYLYRYHGLGKTAERNRPCPACGTIWALPERIHHLFDFKCEPCHLLSNIALSSSRR